MQVLLSVHIKPFEHKQFDEQNPDNRPEFNGHLYKLIIFKNYLSNI
jgi:hypothetical protein